MDCLWEKLIKNMGATKMIHVWKSLNTNNHRQNVLCHFIIIIIIIIKIVDSIKTIN